LVHDASINCGATLKTGCPFRKASGPGEKQARDQTPDAGEMKADCGRRFRQQHSLPVLTALKSWLDNIAPKVVPEPS